MKYVQQINPQTGQHIGDEMPIGDFVNNVLTQPDVADILQQMRNLKNGQTSVKNETYICYEKKTYKRNKQNKPYQEKARA